MIVSAAEHALYLYAISCALSTLVNYAGRFGRGWHHVANGSVIISTEVAL